MSCTDAGLAQSDRGIVEAIHPDIIVLALSVGDLSGADDELGIGAKSNELIFFAAGAAVNSFEFAQLVAVATVSKHFFNLLPGHRHPAHGIELGILVAHCANDELYILCRTLTDSLADEFRNKVIEDGAGVAGSGICTIAGGEDILHGFLHLRGIHIAELAHGIQGKPQLFNEHIEQHLIIAL